MTGILWPLVPADLARTAPGGTSYVLRVTANGVTENLTTPTMSAGRLYWMAGDAQADADGGVGGVGDLIAILQATLETHSELTAINSSVNLDASTNVITISVTGLAWTILWSHASTTLSALPWGWTQVDVSGSDVGGGLYRAIAPNQSYGAFLPGRALSFDSREKSAFKVRAAKSISDLQRTSRVAVGKPTRDLRFDLLAQAYALREYSPATRPTGTAEDVYLFAASVGRPVRYYPAASSRTSTSYSGPYVFRAEEGLDSRESVVDFFGEPRIRRFTFRLPLRSWSSSASGVSFAGVSSPAGGGGAPVAAQYVTLATHADLTAERVLTAGSGITLTDGGAGGALTAAAWSRWATSVRLPVGFASANATSNLSPTSGTSYAFYLGRADRSLTQAVVQWVHTVNSATITWAEIAICSGSLVPGSAATLTARGYTDVSGVITSGAPAAHTTTVALSGIAAGDDLWLVYGISATTAGSLRAGNLVDTIGAGFVQSASVRPQSISATAFTVQSSTNHFWAATGLS